MVKYNYSKYPGNISLCNETTNRGGLTVKQLRVLAVNVFDIDIANKNKSALCNAIESKIVGVPPIKNTKNTKNTYNTSITIPIKNIDYKDVDDDDFDIDDEANINTNEDDEDEDDEDNEDDEDDEDDEDET